MIGSRCATTFRKLPITSPNATANAICAASGKMPNVTPTFVARLPSDSNGMLKRCSDAGLDAACMVNGVDSAAMLHHVAELNDGKIHCDHETADQQPQHDDH